MNRLLNTVTFFLSQFVRIFTGGRDWWRPICFSRLVHYNMSNSESLPPQRSTAANPHLAESLFKSLRFLPSGYDVPLHVQRAPEAPSTPYQIFYNLYKPSTPFKKTAPPLPDFSVVVVK